MISLVVPTRNRAHTLRLVAPSYFAQDGIDELVFVEDAGEDDTGAVLREIGARFPDKRMRHVRNATRMGAPASRNIGVAQCTNDFVLFCDDDEYMEPGYALTCLNKLSQQNLGAISGRRVYMLPGETQNAALRRFSHGMHRSKPFRPVLCEYVNGAIFDGDVTVPVTNANILTRRALLQQYGFDETYCQGSGYREESDYQMNLFVNGHETRITNDCHTFHLPMAQVRTGGQRVSASRRVYWSVKYTDHMFRKYYDAYAKKLGLRTPRPVALAYFACFAVYRETVRPPLYKAAMWMLRNARKGQESRAAAAEAQAV